MGEVGGPQLPDLPSDATVSAWVGPIGGPAVWTLDPNAAHSAASTMKVLVLVGYLQAVASGRLRPDDVVVMHSDFASADGRSRFDVDEASDDDRLPWTWTRVPLRRLAERMITHSSNLATDLVIERVGFGAVVAVGAAFDGVHVRRWIDDQPAQAAGLANTVTAAGLAGVFTRLRQGQLLAPTETATAIDLLSANTWNDEIPAGLPPELRLRTRTAGTTASGTTRASSCLRGDRLSSSAC